jgi:murein DD-endopeptidase MepM/ murein hydrolase activator NlpD
VASPANEPDLVRIVARALGAAALAVLLAACGSSRPPPVPPPSTSNGKPPVQVHVVQPGETLWRISQRYGTTVEALARLNRLRDPTQIAAGQRLVVPNGRRRSTLPVARTPGSWTRSDARGRTREFSVRWPMRGEVSSGFGMRDGAHHDGLDIPARKGTPIRASESGRVIYSDNRLSGYGNMVIVKHAGRLSTVYAHNRRNLVRAGDFVERGQIVAEVGDSGRASAPHLHFEVRDDGNPRDPLHYLPR